MELNSRKLAAIRRFALSLPDTTEEPHHDRGSFRVRGKIFVTVPPGHEFVNVFVDELARESALATHSECLEKLLWGGKVVGLRVNLGAASQATVLALVKQAWEHKASQARRTARPRD
jgi:hypothetical protein